MRAVNILRGLSWPMRVCGLRMGNLWRQMRLMMISAPRLHPGAQIVGPLPDLADSVSIGSNAVLVTAPTQRITIGSHTKLKQHVFLHAAWGPITIGERCSINPFCCLYGHGPLRIGNHVLIASHVSIIPSMHIFSDASRTIKEQGTTKQGITIGDDVWIGAGAVVLDGVTVGKGAVIGAGAVVKESVAPYTVVAGVPARVIRRRE